MTDQYREMMHKYGRIFTVLGITVITVTYHAIKAAIINPSDTLRYE